MYYTCICISYILDSTLYIIDTYTYIIHNVYYIYIYHTGVYICPAIYRHACMHACMQILPQAEAERLKRAEILRSEGERMRLINLAKGQKEATVLNAEGQAQAIRERAAAAAESARKIAETTNIAGSLLLLFLLCFYVFSLLCFFLFLKA